MSKEAFITKRFKKSSLDIIALADGIIGEYQRQGFVLTLRQLYYQFVARGLMENKQANYTRLGGIVSDARLAGYLDWAGMEDRTRGVEAPSAWEDPASIVEAIADQYQEDLWAGQDFRPEVWIEKEALAGVIVPVCERWRVPYFACRGYVSQSAQYVASKRFHSWIRKGQTPIVLHLGDHDPSGIDMTRENAEKMNLLVGEPVEVRRLALNMDQVERYDPPPNPAKDTDSRFEGYRERFGDESWELDALDPTVIDALIDTEVQALLDKRKWALAKAAEERNRNLLTKVHTNWDDVVENLP
jgi:hypothetical protein